MNIAAIYKREMRSYFSTPLAYIFIVIFLTLAGIFTFYLGGFLARGQADLEPFFTWHPCSLPRHWACGCGPRRKKRGLSNSS